jgi:hypothetical protein
MFVLFDCILDLFITCIYRRPFLHPYCNAAFYSAIKRVRRPTLTHQHFIDASASLMLYVCFWSQQNRRIHREIVVYIVKLSYNYS